MEINTGEVWGRIKGTKRVKKTKREGEELRYERSHASVNFSGPCTLTGLLSF
jgi:hypothetical protein